MYINLFNWLVKIRTIKVSVLYDMHERSNSTFWEIYIRWQRGIVKVRIFEKVKKCCSLESHPNRNWNYETPQIGIHQASAWSFPRCWRERSKGETSSEAPDWPGDTWSSCKVVFSCSTGLRSWAGNNSHSRLQDQGLT